MKDLTIKRDHLRLRYEQEIKNLMLRLRSSYLMNLDLKGGITRVMLRPCYTLLRSLDILAELKTVRAPQKSQRNPLCSDFHIQKNAWWGFYMMWKRSHGVACFRILPFIKKTLR